MSVFDKPVITQQPQSLTVVEGGNATFTVAAISATPIRYQWRFNSTALADKTNSTLSLANVQAENDGLYDVVVSDDFGSVVSDLARLTVLLKPRITQMVTNYTVVQGGSVDLERGNLRRPAHRLPLAPQQQQRETRSAIQPPKLPGPDQCSAEHGRAPATVTG